MTEDIDISPLGTHNLYLNTDTIPRFDPESGELIQRLDALRNAGFVAIAGILVGSWDTSVSTALSMHELASNHLRKGALIGPYCMSYAINMPGVKLYMLDLYSRM